MTVKLLFKMFNNFVQIIWFVTWMLGGVIGNTLCNKRDKAGAIRSSFMFMIPFNQSVQGGYTIHQYNADITRLIRFNDDELSTNVTLSNNQLSVANSATFTIPSAPRDVHKRLRCT